jgi:hypothetical protein
MSVNSTLRRGSRKAKAKSASDKPPKPYDGFPLSSATCGKWQKKIRDRIYYFGNWGRVVNGTLEQLPYKPCWQTALADYEAKREALHSGRTPASMAMA